MAFSLFESTLLVPKTEFKIDMENFFESRYTNLRIQCEGTPPPERGGESSRLR